MMVFTPILIGALVMAVGVIAWAVITHNGLVKAGLRVDEAWSTVAVQLKRYANLVPNLVETVRGYAAHERETLEAVIRARSGLEKASDAGQAEAANASLTGALVRLFALVERYPDLKASANFTALQKELSDLEEKIAFARQFYNRTVLDHNSLAGTLPSSIIASVMGVHPRAFFEVDQTAQLPAVGFVRQEKDEGGGRPQGAA